MAYLVLARKYRPQRFEDVVAQPHVTQTLQNAISAGRVAHAILFAGPRGTGKTTVARILAKAMNCEKGPTPTPCNVCRSCKEITAGYAGDVSEIDGASNNSVDQVRELRENLRYLPTQSRFRIYIIDEVHMLTTAAFNALLKTLEEPPAHVLFMFATTEPHKIPITILSRCQRHDLRRIDLPDVTAHLERLADMEGVRIPKESLWLISRESEGSMRDALSLLDQVMAFSVDKAVAHEAVVDLLGVVDRQTVFDLSDGILKKDVPRILDIVEALYQRGIDLKRAYGDLLRHVRDLMVVKLGHAVERLVAVSPDEIVRMRDQAAGISSGSLGQLYELLFQEENSLRFAAQPRIALEMALIKVVQLEPTFTMEELIGRIDTLRTAGASWRLPPPENTAAKPIDAPPPEAQGAEIGIVASQGPVEVASANPLQDRDAAWNRIRRRVSEQAPFLEAVLDMSRLDAVTPDNTLQIVVQGPAFNVTLIADKEPLIKEASREVFGKPVKILIRSDGTHEARQTASRNRREQLEKEARSHPMVAAALEQFRGKIIDVIIPEEDQTYEGHGIHDEAGPEITEPDAEDAGGIGAEDG